VGLRQLAIADFRLPIEQRFERSKSAIGNWQLKIENELWLNTKKDLF
jgi:hypothetical protein